jgi:hypothetical protein
VLSSFAFNFNLRRYSMLDLAKLVAHLPLSLEDHWMFAVAPCKAGACTRFPFQLNTWRELLIPTPSTL